MQRPSSCKHAFQKIVGASCVSLLTTAFAVADFGPQSAPLEKGVVNASGESGAEHDPQVIPASCTEDCCGDEPCSSCACGKSGCDKKCCCCKAVCCPKRVTEEVKKHCWLVKSELICIPRFQFNLFNDHTSKSDVCCGNGCDCQNCCHTDAAPCGRVRCINVLEKHEFKCEECGYEWDVKWVRTSKKCCRSKKCCCPSCGNKCGQCAEQDTPADNIRLATAEESSATVE